MNGAVVVGGSVLALGLFYAFSGGGKPQELPPGTIITFRAGYLYRHRVRIDGTDFDAETVKMAIENIDSGKGLTDVRQVSESPMRFEFTMPPKTTSAMLGRTEQIKSPSGKSIDVVVEQIFELGPVAPGGYYRGK